MTIENRSQLSYDGGKHSPVPPPPHSTADTTNRTQRRPLGARAVRGTHMADLTTRFAPDLEIRNDGTGRRIYGIAAPFDQPATVNDGFGEFEEIIRPGAFAKTLAERGDRVKLLSQHQRTVNPLGVFEELREDAAGLFVQARLSRTQAADEALELVRDGALDGWSIGFAPIREQWSTDRARRDLLEVALREVSLVTFPAYEGAYVAGVRSATPSLSPAAAQLRLARLIVHGDRA